MKQNWDIPAAISLYNIDRWGSGYFTINDKGRISILPTQDATKQIDIMEAVEESVLPKVLTVTVCVAVLFPVRGSLVDELTVP